MRIEIAKGSDRDWLTVIRADDSILKTTFPKKGTIPHDAVHFFVERALGFTAGFWGMVAGGEEPESIQEIAKGSGHASAKRAVEPDDSIVELLQAERLVECFEASVWSEAIDTDSFRETFAAACRSSCVPEPIFDDAAIEAVYDEILSFAEEWHALPTGGALYLHWRTINGRHKVE